MDENLFYWKEEKVKKLKAIVTTHVDDCGAGAKNEWLTLQHKLLVEKFGTVTRQTLPFVHCGVQYSKIPDGFRMTQDDFCKKLKPASISNDRKDNDDLTPSEVTMFRSILGALLWLTATRLDLVADVCLLQTQVTLAKVTHLRQANNTVKRAQSVEPNLGLIFRKLRGPLRVMCIHDSSAAGNVRHYAQEGILVVLAEDKLQHFTEYGHVLSNDEARLLGGTVHVLWAHGAKAKRVSYSTSHAETLAAISGLEAASLVTVRLAELLYVPKPSFHSLLAVQERGVRQLPIDDLGDCRDLYELVCGDRGITQDKGQRLYVLALREARMSQRLRWIGLVPTASMTADALTKSMLAPPMMQLLSSGTVSFFNEEKHHIVLRSLPFMKQVEEHHLDLSDKELIREVGTLATSLWCASRTSASRTTCFFFWATLSATSSTAAATARPTSSPTTTTTSSSTMASEDDDHRSLLTFVALVLSTEWLLWGFARYWWQRLCPRRASVAAMEVAPSSGDSSPTDVDTSNLFSDDPVNERPDAADAFCQADLPAPEPDPRISNWAIEHINVLENKVRSLTENERALYDEIQVLRAMHDSHIETIGRLNRDLMRYQGTDPNGLDLFTTAATGRTWHRDRNCHHLRNVRTRQMRCCFDCGRG